MSTTTGLSKSRLQRMHDVLSEYIERKDLPGLVALVSRDGEVHVEKLGTMSIGDPAPMKRDTIFRIASITKPITAVAAMILVEECKLRLDDSIEAWIPELAKSTRTEVHILAARRHVSCHPRHHRSRLTDVLYGLRQRDGDAGYLSDSEVDP